MPVIVTESVVARVVLGLAKREIAQWFKDAVWGPVQWRGSEKRVLGNSTAGMLMLGPFSNDCRTTWSGHVPVVVTESVRQQ